MGAETAPREECDQERYYKNQEQELRNNNSTADRDHKQDEQKQPQHLSTSLSRPL